MYRFTKPGYETLLDRVATTGQLALLALIERLELAGITVVSANMDGIEMKVPEGLEAVASSIMTRYRATSTWNDTSPLQK